MVMCNGPVIVKMGMRGLTSQSTMEAELVAEALATRETEFCHSVMAGVDSKEEFNCVPLHIGNTSAL